MRAFSRLFFCVFFATNVFANIEQDISLNTQKLAQNNKEKTQLSQKLEVLGKNIQAKNNEVIRLDSQIESLQKEINQSKNKYSAQEQALQENQKRHKQLLERQSALENEILTLFSQGLAFYMLSEHIESPEDVLSREAYMILFANAKKRIKTLNTQKQKLSNDIIAVSKNITQIQNSIDESTKKKNELESAKMKQEQILLSMQGELKIYNQKLQEINNERKNLDSILNNLKITQAQNQKKIEEKIKKEEEDNAKKPQQKRTITADKNIKIASSAYKDISTIAYKGAKTIAPLDSFMVEQKFGPTFDPVYKMKFFYENVILVPKKKNADVKSVLDGKIVFAKENPVIKKVIIIEHTNSLYTVYAYLDKISATIKPGVHIKKGYIIGKVNEKLSFEVTQKDKHIDPLQLIKVN
ncbi:murein hydrolase activator EnvC family protein [Helicobacter himalayensis]|uniref:murein hydrolase activator EnvC family protein n=1 Tax=Helicobacter himalayensis TaxID=1591088 RepID=UPI003D6DD6D6